MSRLIFITLSTLIIFNSFGQENEVSFIQVYGKVLNKKDSTAVSASVLYEKLPYYDDMGMGNSGVDGAFEFYLIRDVKYNFTVKKTDYNPAKMELQMTDEDGDGAISFTIYIEETEEKKLITLNNLIFSRGSEKISESSFKELDELVTWLDSRPDMIIQLEGHTDFAGNEAANLRLSQARVESVKEYLISKGVKKARVLTKAFGGTQPLTTERTDEAKAKNRRVEVRIIK
ncbi:MAG: OOP family OmpA-OmpF porin [Cyclobacteriaceae bacterium]|jgi:OOP family OmpA-OmpF porin